MDHYRLSDELRQQLLESAAWGKAGIKPAARLDEKKSSCADEGEMPAKKKAKKKEKEMEMEMEESEEAVHVCPLCVSQLDEAIDEDRILEHLNVVVGLVDRLTQHQEGEEDIESVIDETLAELLFQDLEEE